LNTVLSELAAGVSTPGGGHRVRDFEDLRDRALVTAAYRAMLRREPDAAGLEAYLGHVRRGMSSVELLRCLRYSAEGRRVGARISGLSRWWALLRPVARRWRALWRLPEAELARNAFEEGMAARVTAIEAKLADMIDKSAAEATFESMRDLLHALENAKADRADVAELSRIKADKTEGEELRLLKADREELLGAMAGMATLEQRLVKIGDLRRSHDEQCEKVEQIIRALEEKSNRREVTALTGSLLRLAATQVGKDELATVERSLRALAERGNHAGERQGAAWAALDP
jgi:hypothetical protein